MQKILIFGGWGIANSLLQPLAESLTEHGFQVELSSIVNIVDPQQLKQQLEYAQQFDIIIGWSLGGLIAATLVHHLYTEFHQVKNLITIASNPQFVADEYWQAAMPQDRFNDFKESFEKAPNLSFKRFCYLMTQGHAHAKLEWQRLQHLIETENQIQQNFALPLWEKGNYLSILHHKQIAQLHLFYQEDALIPEQVAENLVKLSTQKLKIEVLKGCHAELLIQPNLSIDKMIQFMNALVK